jgi:lipid A 3-O-deacylase PagL
MLSSDRCLARVILGVLFVFVSSPPQALAQGPDQYSPDKVSVPDRNSISLHMVGTVGNGSLQGTSKDRRLFLLGAAYNRLLTKRTLAAFTFTSQLVPVALLREPYLLHTDIQAVRKFPLSTETRRNYGAGASPAGIKVNFFPDKKVQPFIGIQGGFLYFSRRALSSNASQFNFNIDGRAGVEFSLPSGKAISFAYMFQHMSNAFIAKEDPGVDSHMLTLAYRFPLRLGKQSGR